MHPLLFTSIIKTMIWGSESWDITCRHGEMGVIESVPAAGMRFDDFISQDPPGILGTSVVHAQAKHPDGGYLFPLLVKIIDARDTLSVQVHPNDTYAKSKGETDSGKSEIWYVLEPPTDRHLILGLKPGVGKDRFADACRDGTIEDCLNRVSVEKGDIIDIPAGLVHALTPGARIAEIQQNSDITYRIYDYGRVGPDGIGRQLHLEDALNVINFDAKAEPIRGLSPASEACPVITNEHFNIYKLCPADRMTVTANSKAFHIVTCVSGECRIDYGLGEVILTNERSVFIPANMGGYTIVPTHPHTVLLKSAPEKN